MVRAGGEKPACAPRGAAVGFPPAIPLLFGVIPQTCLDTSCLYACRCFKPEPHHLSSRPSLPTAHEAGLVTCWESEPLDPLSVSLLMTRIAAQRFQLECPLEREP